LLHEVYAVDLGWTLAGWIEHPSHWEVIMTTTFNLAPGGVYLFCKITFAKRELLPHDFTLSRHTHGDRCCFCGTVPFRPDGERLPLTATVFEGVRTFLTPDVLGPDL